MRSFPMLLVELLLSLSFAVTLTVPNTRHDNYRLIGRAGEPEHVGVRPDRPEIQPPSSESGPHTEDEIDTKVIISKAPEWNNPRIRVFDSEDPDLPKAGSSAASFVKRTKGTDGQDRFEVVLMPSDMADTINTRFMFNSGKGPGSLELGSKAEWNARISYGSSPESRKSSRLQAFGTRLKYGKGNEPEGNPVRIGTLNSATARIRPEETFRWDELMEYATKLTGNDGYDISYGIRSDAIAPDGFIMAQPPSVGGVIAKSFKSLYLNLQRTAKVIVHNGKPSLAAGPDSGQEIQRKIKRSNPIGSISKIESDTATKVTNTTNDLITAFEEYYSAFTAVQANSTALILPFLDILTNSSNSSLVFDAAWSIWNDLTIQAEHTAGPFLYGSHCLDQIEDEFLQQNNLTTNSTEYLDLLALDSILIDAYQLAWNQSLAAMQQSGLRDQITTLAGYLSSPPPGVQPTWFNSTAGQVYDDQYFVPPKTPV